MKEILHSFSHLLGFEKLSENEKEYLEMDS